MPTYEYVCNACGHEFEQFQSITAAPIKKCPACGKNSVARKIGIGGAILFRGGGFYETDYRSDSYKKAEETEMGKTKPASDAKSDTPPAKPTEAAKDTSAKSSASPATSTSGKAAEKAPESASKATHPSRVGRGIGNLIGGSSLGGGPSKSSLGGGSLGASGSSKLTSNPTSKPAPKPQSHPSGKQAGKPTGVPRRTSG